MKPLHATSRRIRGYRPNAGMHRPRMQREYLPAERPTRRYLSGSRPPIAVIDICEQCGADVCISPTQAASALVILCPLCRAKRAGYTRLAVAISRMMEAET